ncbi:MAG: cold shock domain-containing protein [Acidimicrobiales bacterium]
MIGVVIDFDEGRGLGTVRGEDGREVSFHCTAVADGTRTVPVGARVAYSVVAGHLGRWEATALERVGDG